MNYELTKPLRGWLAAVLIVLALITALTSSACSDSAAPLPLEPAPVDSPPPVVVDTPPPGPALTYQFGAKFEPPVGRVVHGMGQWEVYNPKYLALLPVANKPGAELRFIDLGDTPRGWDAAQIAAGVAAVGAAGRVPVLDLALRGLQPSHAAFQQLADKTYGIDSAVAYSSQYDARIQSFIDVLRAYNKPVMLRIGGEFSGSWNGYHPYAYPVAFRKIVHMFRASGVNNVAFVWCFEPAAANDFDEVNAAGQAKWYPGDDVVDWFSIDLYATNDVSGPTAGHTGALSSYGKTLRFLDMAVAKHRPVIIAESAPMQYDLADQSQASAAWSQWFAPYFALIESRGEIKWFHYVNYDWTKAGYYLESGWKNNDLSANSALAAKYVAEIAKGKYLHSGELGLLKGWQ